MEEGIFYIGTGEKYFNQAVESVKTVTDHNDIKISILTTPNICNSHSGELFDEIVTIEDSYDSLKDKVYHLDKTPYDRTLFLDGDTYVTGDISDIFELLERVQIAATPPSGEPELQMPDVPECFPELNTGVLAYRSSEEVFDFFKSWQEIYEDQLENGRPNAVFPRRDIESMEETFWGRMHDQPPFREALFKTELRFAVLSNEYNFRGWGASASTEIKIIHENDRELLSDVVNDKLGQRVYLGDKVQWSDGHIVPLAKDIPIVDKMIKVLPVRDLLVYIGIWSKSKDAYDRFSKKYRKLIR